jgi:hypothetical protein
MDGSAERAPSAALYGVTCNDMAPLTVGSAIIAPMIEAAPVSRARTNPVESTVAMAVLLELH